MSPTRLLVLPAALAALALPAAASASTVSVAGGHVSYRAAQGEVNDVQVRLQGRAITVADSAPLTAGPGCASTGATSAICAVTSHTFAGTLVLLRDGNDSFATDAHAPAWVRGGAGNDTYFGGHAPGGNQVAFSGGRGRDTVDYSEANAPVEVSFDGVANDGREIDADDIGADVEHVLAPSA